MNIIYYCFAGAHASVVASAIHCGFLSTDRIPEAKEFLAVDYYDSTLPELIGRPYFMGRDKEGHHVYFMGMWSQRADITSTIQTVLALGGWKQEDYILQDAFPLINFSIKFGGLLSKRWRFTKLGRSLTIWGMRRQYPAFVKMVEEVQLRITILDTKNKEKLSK